MKIDFYIKKNSNKCSQKAPKKEIETAEQRMYEVQANEKDYT